MATWVLESERLGLRVKRPDDAPLLGYVAEHAEHQERFGFSVWALVDRSTGEVVGEAGLLVCDEGVEIAWGVLPAHRGRGYAEEAGRAILAHAFGPLGLDQVWAFVDEDNGASQRIAERLGMEHVRSEPGDDEVAPWREYAIAGPI